MLKTTKWEPPSFISEDAILEDSEEVLSLPEMEWTAEEDIIRIRVADMDWDIGSKVYQPTDPSRITRGADGKKAGLFLLHGGAADHRYFAPIAPLLAGKFGYKVVSMTYPGRLYLLDPSRDWPGDTVNPDGTARAPIWSADSIITPDQYELVQDRSNLTYRKKWGTFFLLKAREDTEFYHRMAAWPLAFEEGMRALCARHFPEGEYSVYTHGHSTGGPFAHYITQRVPNVAGVIGMESSLFSYIGNAMTGFGWDYPFNCLVMRTWRHIARYLGPEAGEEGAMRLPMLMEEVFEAWERAKVLPQFKAEYPLQYAALDTLAAAARVTAKRLRMDREETEALVERYQSYTRELSGEGVKPVPPILVGVAKNSATQTPEQYQQTALPMFQAMRPSPKVRLISFGAGVHSFMKAQEGLPCGVGPTVIKLWNAAIKEGYFAEG